MSAPDYLWPARPEYLRIGTPLVDLRGRRGALVTDLGSDGWVISDRVLARQVLDADDDIGWSGSAGTGEIGGGAPLRYQLDLRDVTARAHAAMAWTTFHVNDIVLTIGPRAGLPPPDALRRMRMLDESVTVAEAREALAWAERAAGVAS